MEKQIQESTELARSDEQVYQLDLQLYQIVFPNFKYEPPSFVSMEIGTNNKPPTTTPSMVQHVATTKLRSGTCLETIPLPIQIFIVHVQVTTTTTEFVEGSDKFVKEQIKHVLDNGTRPLEFLFATLPLTPHHIGIGQEITLIINTMYVSKVFTTPITTFEETFN